MSIFGADGQIDIRVDTVGFLANTLRGYEATSILREQLQNADDACHVQQRTGELRLEFLDDRLVVTNPSIFNDDDWARLTRPSSRGKFTDEEQTGEFGIGFWGSLHLTDVPVVTSGSAEVTLQPTGVATKREVDHLDGTRFEFVYRRQATEIGDQLDVGMITPDVEAQMIAVFVNQMAELLLFTKAIDAIALVLPDGQQLRATRAVEALAPTVDRLTVEVDGAPEQSCHFLVVTTEIADPPPHRHGRVAAALPISDRHRGEGQVFVTFPTETSTGLNLSINAHFRATDDRRSLENAGEHGKWNSRIFEAAGLAVGTALETILDESLTGVSYQDSIGWFEDAQAGAREVGERARRFLELLDLQAVIRPVVLDQDLRLRRSAELVCLERKIEKVLGPYVGDTVAPGLTPEVRSVLRRWGLRTWGPADVANWLAAHVPHEATRQDQAPPFLRSNRDALELIEYCEPAARRLEGVAILLGEDDRYHPAFGSLARAAKDHLHLIGGLDQPVVHPSFVDTAVGRAAPRTDAQWLRNALKRSTNDLVGKRVPHRAVAVVSKQSHIDEALEILCGANQSLAGIPLAIDEQSIIGVFDDSTVFGLPSGAGRKSAAALARRLGLVPVNASIDRKHLEGEVLQFGVSLILEQIAEVADWDPIVDSRLLIETLSEIRRDREISPALVDRLRSLQVWAGSDGHAHALSDLRLPARTSLGETSSLLLDRQLVGELDPAANIYSTFKELLRVDVLDGTEEVVMLCENPPLSLDDRRALLEAFGDCDEFSVAQRARLRESAFVLCSDGSLRRPADVFLTGDVLPLDLGDRRVDDVGLERRTRSHLEALGAVKLPSAEDLRQTAAEISKSPILAQDDPGRLMWDFLTRDHTEYPAAAVSALADIPWLVTRPGPERRAPSACYDPQLSFAAFLFPIPDGVATPMAELRDRLRIRASLDAGDCVRLGQVAAERDLKLEPRYFQYLNRLAVEASPFETGIAALADVEVFLLAGGSRARPKRLVPEAAHRVWGHLRDRAPDSFSSDYPNLARAWGMSIDEEIGWLDHLDVLEELGDLKAPEQRDFALARARLESLAEMGLDGHQLGTVRRRGVLLTSNGLTPCSEAFRGDLPASILDRLRVHLPIIEEWDLVVSLLDDLDSPAVSGEIELEAVTSGLSEDESWGRRLRMQAANVLRFLKASNGIVDQTLLASWPPAVLSANQLSVRAFRNGAVIDEWRADAHLEKSPAGLTLYVGGLELDARDVVDAISTAFGIDRGRKSLLLQILNSPTAGEASQILEWEGLAALSDAETSYLHDGLETEIVFADAEEYEEAPYGLPTDASEPAPAIGATESLDTAPNEQASDIEAFDEPGDQLPQEPSDVGMPGPDELVDDALPYERAQSPRGVTDIHRLASQGITAVYDLDTEAEESGYEPQRPDDEEADSTDERDDARVCLSYYDVLEGLLPLNSRTLRHLTSGYDLETVLLLGDSVPARAFGQHHVLIEDGAMLFAKREIVPGTIIRAHPASPGSIELVLREDPHRVDGVWMLELDEHGKLDRIRQDDLELRWETDDAFYRAERRLEDIEALMKDGGKSALQLVIEVFLNRPGEGLTSDEVWGLVAVNRLFAKATISMILSQQNGLFENRDGLWYKTGDELRMIRRERPQRTSNRPSRASQSESGEVLRLARRLVRLSETADLATVRQVRSILDVDWIRGV